MEDLDICVYHSNCSDGISSAWCIQQKYPDIAYIGMKAGKDIPNKYLFTYNNKSIIFVDICPSKISLEYLLENAKHITILDHHKTNKDFITKYSNNKLSVKFDMNLSGCQLSWNYIYPNIERPWFIDYIADRDLWTFKLPNSRLINMALFEFDYINFKGLDKLYKKYNTENEKEKFFENTLLPNIKIINEKNNKIIENTIQRASKAKITINDITYIIWISFSTLGILKSDLGNRLMNIEFNDDTEPDFVAVVEYNFPNDEWWYSLRSKSDKTDVSVIAKYFGGGGHPCASGFTLYENPHTYFKLLENYDY